MRIGVDFDNTIISYDRVFNHVGVEKGLVPEDLAFGKNRVRGYLRNAGREDLWTWLQGYVYGARLSEASLYKGVRSFFDFCNARGIDCVIISHKTQYPYSGDPYDLHLSARSFIQMHKLPCEVFFEPTKEDKINRINALRCDWFIDDLPEFLQLPGFSDKIVRFLFDPLKEFQGPETNFEIVHSWEQITRRLKATKRC